MPNNKFTFSVEYVRSFYGSEYHKDFFVEALTFSAAVTKARRHLTRLNSHVQRGHAKWVITSISARENAI